MNAYHSKHNRPFRGVGSVPVPEIRDISLRAPRVQLCGDATQAMLFHRRGAASIEMRSRRRNPKGRWVLRAISASPACRR
jgi:hypothetical protein